MLITKVRGDGLTHRTFLLLTTLILLLDGSAAAWMVRPTFPVEISRTKPSCRDARYYSAWERQSRNSPIVDDDDEEEEEKMKRENNELDQDFDLDAFLDTPFFDPDQVLKDENSSPLLRRIASFVQQDYETAEAVMAGAFFVILIIFSQEVLRMQFYGDNYVPFAKGVSPASLF